MAKKFFFLSFYNLFFFFLNFLFFSFLFFSFPGIIPLHFHIATILTTKFLKVPLRFLVSFSYWHCLFLFPSNCHNNDMYPSRIVIDVYFFFLSVFSIYLCFFLIHFWNKKGIEKKEERVGYGGIHPCTTRIVAVVVTETLNYPTIKRERGNLFCSFILFVAHAFHEIFWSPYCRHLFPFHFFLFFLFYFFISFHLDCPSYFHMWKPCCYY